MSACKTFLASLKPSHPMTKSLAQQGTSSETQIIVEYGLLATLCHTVLPHSR